MGLADRLAPKQTQLPPAPVPGAPKSAPAPSFQGPSAALQSLSARFHQLVLERLDLAVVGQLGPQELQQRLAQSVDQLAVSERAVLSAEEKRHIVESVFHELVGLGPLETLLKDPSISDILINASDVVFVERAGKLERVPVRFRDDRHLINIIQRIASRVGRRIDESSPMVDARLADGSRVNAVIPPLAIDGPSMSIRRFGSRPLDASALARNGAMSAEMLEYLSVAVRSRCSILIAGGTGAGKTTMLNALSSFIPEDERIITVEDAAELRLMQPHVVRLESRPANLEGKGEVAIRDLVRNALRMRPDRIVVGECRGAEVLDMLQAMNTGHEGSMSTVHANNTRDVVSRLTTMLGMAGTALSEETMKTIISRAVHLIVHVSRFSDGRRRVTGISELTGQMGATIQLHDVFVFERTGTGANGAILGTHKQLAKTALGHLMGRNPGGH
ncbi:MAG: CpaF family protein [Myxococcaceae bacterium]|nr:CpaF family protein [Myxococcaceae bacterium]